MQSFWEILGLIPIFSDFKKRKDLIMKQTVEEAEKEYYEKNYLGVDINRMMVENAFEAGADWQSKQSPWISVEERLPEENADVFFAVEWNAPHKIGYFVGSYFGNGQWDSYCRIFLPDSLLARVTYWMPIPSFDEILEANRDVLERIKEKGD